jgi:competence ComEA-like helix-hairpin-helix protein
MRWKELVVDYFSFTRRDRIAIITLLLIISGVFFLPKAISHFNRSKPTRADTAWIAAMTSMEQKEPGTDQQHKKYDDDDNSNNYQYDRSANNYYDKPKGELFYFDPNTLSIEGWQKLGLRDKTIQTIQNYLSKSGRFKKSEDLKRVYGLFPNEYERIAPYIKIEATDESNNFNSNKNVLAEIQPAKTFPSRYAIIDINTADTAAFISLPGIGSKLAARIINFRDKLGGFYTINQVGETFGLPDSTFQNIKQYLKLDYISIRKININTATVDELKMHPYIKWNLANPIIAYRNEHGPFTKIEDLKKVMAITEEVYSKLAPYIVSQ